MKAPDAPRDDEWGDTQAERDALPMVCDRCDGCGWYEGGVAIQTTCEECGGTGVTRHNDASRESSGAAVESSRSSHNDPALTPPSSVSLPLDLQAWERLARAAEQVRGATFEPFTARLSAYPASAEQTDHLRDWLVFLAEATPERILGLIDAAQQGAEDKARLDWIDKRVGQNEGLIVQAWDHDGRRIIPRDKDGWACLMVLKFAARGGADEGVREAIDAVTHSAPSPESSDHALATPAPEERTDAE